MLEALNRRLPFKLDLRLLLELAAAGFAALLISVMVRRVMAGTGLLLTDGNPFFGDFIAFWSAGRVVLDGHAEQVHIPAVVQAVQWHAVPGMRWVAPWNSPPQFLLIAVVLGLFPFPVAAVLWMVTTGAIYLYAMRKLLPDARALIFAVTAPAALYHLGSVQTGLWIAGISGLALYWLDSKPLRAGALVGLLAIKPHMAVIWPIYLLVTGRWRAFAAAAASLTLFTLAAILAFGWESIPRFINNLGYTQDLITHLRVAKTTFASLYGNLMAIGAKHQAALIVHGVSALGALALSIWVFRRGDARAQGAALCAMTMLATPYAFFYDTTLLAIGAAMLGVPRDKFEIVGCAMAWGAAATLGFAQLVAPLPIAPAAAWMVLACAARRAHAEPSRFRTQSDPARSTQSSALAPG